MKRLELVLAILLLIGACFVADHTIQRVKKVETQCDKVLTLVADSSALLLTEIQAESDRIEALKAKCPACKPCTCPPKPRCCSCSPCECKPCVCCKYGDCCNPKALPTAPFDHFLWIQLHDGKVWFGWVDVDGDEHETRMMLEEFERWGEED